MDNNTSTSNPPAEPAQKQPCSDSASIPRPTRSVQPNSMTYTDDKGVEHNIYLPRGTALTAFDHLENERWDELAKFEPYSEFALRMPRVTSSRLGLSC